MALGRNRFQVVATAIAAAFAMSSNSALAAPKAGSPKTPETVVLKKPVAVLKHEKSVTEDGSPTPFVWSPDGERIAWGNAQQVGIWSKDGKRQMTMKFADDPSGRLGRLVWSHNGTRLLSTDRFTGTHIWDTKTGKQVTTFTKSDDPQSSAFSPDDTAVVSTSKEDHIVRVWSATTGKELWSVEADYSSSVAWSPDGKSIAVAANPSKLMDPATGKVRATLDYALGVRFSPDGKRLALSGAADISGHSSTIFDVATGKRLIELEGKSTVYQNLHWSPNGIFVAGEVDLSSVWVWDAASGKKLLTVEGDSDTISWSADSAMLAVMSANAGVGIWDIKSKTQRYSLPGNRYVAWSPKDPRMVGAKTDKSPYQEIKLWAIPN